MTGTFGREPEMATIRRVLDETAAGAGGCLLIDGPAGIGKSHLLRAAVELAGSSGIAVAFREAFRLDLAAPLVTLAGAVRGCRPAAGEFDWLSSDQGLENQYQTLERLRASLEHAATRQPLLIVIDDAHWMDELSALAVRELVPALASSPVRWLFASSPVAQDTPGRQTLAWLSRDGNEPIHLGALDDAATTRLSTDVVGAEVDNTVLALTAGCGGNPLRIGKLLTTLRATRQLVISGGVATVVGEELPSSFIDTVQDLLGSLSVEAQWLLRATSVFDRPFGIGSAARLTGRAPAELFPLVEEAGTDFLTEEPDGLVFAHQLVRQAIYHTLRKTVRDQLHREAAALAREDGRPALEVAQHLLRTDRSGSAEAVTLLRTAAREVAGAAPATAATLMMHALEALGPHGPGRPALIAEAVGLLASAARLHEARELGEEALRAGLDDETEAVLLLGLAEAFKHGGQNQTAVDYADRGLAPPTVSEATRARLYAIRAHALCYVDQLEAADDSGARSDELGRRSGEYGASVFGLTARSLVAHAEGRLDDAYAHASTATELADRVGGAAVHRHPRIWLGNAQACLNLFEESERTFARGRRESEQLGTAWAQPLWHYYYSSLLAARGQLDDAAAEADAGVETAEQLTAYQLAVPLLGTLIRLAVARGELAQAQGHQARMRRWMSTGITAAPEDVVWAEGLLLHATGESGAALAVLTGLYDNLPDRPALVGTDPGAAATLVRIARPLDAGRAAVVVEATRRLAERNPGSAGSAGAAAHAEGLLNGDPVLLRQAVDLFRATRRPLVLAAALEDAAVAGRGTEPEATVRSRYAEALAIVTRCGARSDQRRLEQRLGAAAPAGAAAPPCLPLLSPAERRVALAVAAGRTNIQVAADLFLSRHTVDSHLRKIFDKLKVNRRVELATLVARECPGNHLST
ncbi:AAA family ATPase [Actinoplanes auranticolor]|uniref:SARP family transcriptional regulator n=1 Tax=Actinoplanes auranticolor TaxID=47988 RepID=A0A919S8Z9_9ACTN|nr:LuxR family transcriptional regulator [Actinoplanes auranticolor]GIM66988.1 SARP family transcriptional regulator [Actinoplanes auranticolor]